MRPLLALIFLSCFSWSFSQGALAMGQFEMEGGNYTIEVKMEGGNLVVVEPKRTTPYTLEKPNRYKYYHEGFDKTYYVDIVDPNTLHFTSSNTSTTTVMKRANAQAIAAAGERHAQFSKIAEKYKALAQDDSPEVQAWTFCAAAAHAGAMKTEEEYREYAYQSARALLPIMVSARNNPCSDAIPQELWNKALSEMN